MLSRVADSIYWMSRYIERAENVARFVDVNLHLGLDMPHGAGQQWRPLVTTTGDDETFVKHYDEATKRNVIEFLTFDRENPNSIISCLTAARENARSIREIISSEMWQSLNRFYLMVNEASRSQTVLGREHKFFEQVQASGQAFVGVTDTTMTHGEGWEFARLGRFIERSDKTSRILDVKYYILLPKLEDVGTPYDEIQWAALLRSASALEMYRQRYGRIEPERVVQFLILDPLFPRAVLYCLTRANEAVHAISGTPVNSFINPVEQQLGQLWAELAYSKGKEIIARGLHEYVDHMQKRLNLVGDAIFDTFFSLRPMESPRLAG